MGDNTTRDLPSSNTSCEIVYSYHADAQSSPNLSGCRDDDDGDVEEHLLSWLTRRRVVITGISSSEHPPTRLDGRMTEDMMEHLSSRPV